jgi:hypothetical protein
VSVISVNTFVHSAGYLAANIGRSLVDIIRGLGLDPGELDHETVERGLKAWIESRHLETVHLEIFSRRTNELVGKFAFDIDYGYSTDTSSFWIETEQVQFAIRKHGLLPSGCSYRVVTSTKRGRPGVEGWSNTTLRSVDGLTRNPVGTAIGAGSTGAGLAYYSRS